MTTTTTPLRSLFSGLSRRGPVQADPADMGTCFGLELSFDAPVDEPPPPAPAQRSWWQRLAPRKASRP